jgi:spore germination cell wall hydrolase CwlJ-like protein
MAEMLLWLTMTVYFEGRGEPVICQEKIARVVLNRMGPDTDIKKVVLSPFQFSWVPEKMHNGILKPEHRPNKESPAWKQAEQSARTALYTDREFKATHFHSISVNPKWGRPFYRTCGNHHFYL